jgi:hypothetical protein
LGARLGQGRSPPAGLLERRPSPSIAGLGCFVPTPGSVPDTTQGARSPLRGECARLGLTGRPGGRSSGRALLRLPPPPHCSSPELAQGVAARRRWHSGPRTSYNGGKQSP